MTQLQPLQALSFETMLAPSSDIGEKGQLTWLKLEQLGIDPTYQRAILKTGKGNIRRMVEEFSWLLFGIVTVCERGGGRYAVIDGQHRATAALLHGGIKMVPCLVLKGGPKDEARAFSAINGNVTRMHVLQSFRAQVAAGDADAAELVRICASAGVTIAPYPKPELEPGETLALGTLRQVMKRHFPAGLVATLKLLRAAEPGAGLGAATIMGTAVALGDRPEWRKNAAPVGKLLADRGGIAKLVTRAAERRVTYGGTEWANFAKVLTSAIDAAQRHAGLPLNKLMGGR